MLGDHIHTGQPFLTRLDALKSDDIFRASDDTLVATRRGWQTLKALALKPKDSGKHYALEFRRFRKKDSCAAERTPFKNHTLFCKDLVDWVVDRGIPGDFTFDSYFTNAEILNHSDGHGRNYVGDLKFNRTITVDGKDWKAIDRVKTQLGPRCRSCHPTAWRSADRLNRGNLASGSGGRCFWVVLGSLHVSVPPQPGSSAPRAPEGR